MPTRNQSGFPSPEPEPDENIVPLEFGDDDALWMLLNTYADGEATAEEIGQVESLMRSHPKVARELSFLQLASDSVHEFGEIDPPETLTSAIFAATARRKTLLQRVSAWWAQTGTVLGPAPLRIGGAALASGILAVLLWSKFGAVPPVPHQSAASDVAILQPHEPVTRPMVIGPVKPHSTVVQTHERIAPVVPDNGSPAPLISAGADGQIEPLQKAVAKMIVHQKMATPLASTGEVRHDNPRRTVGGEAATTTGVVVTPQNVEERHMSADTDVAARTAKPDELGPDVDTASDVHADEVAIAMPAANYDTPPTTVSTVSYQPGSISDKSRNTPPEVQSLYMRTQAAIRRQHDIQQYGGYGKDAYNNIQRREVGLSLVGGRF